MCETYCAAVKCYDGNYHIHLLNICVEHSKLKLNQLAIYVSGDISMIMELSIDLFSLKAGLINYIAEFYR